jgi:hypothetical protein
MKKTLFLGIYFTFIIFCLFAILYYSFIKYSIKENNIKNEFVKYTGLTDLSLSTEAGFIRHRSLSFLNQVFFISPEVRNIFPSDFVYQPSNILNINNSSTKK